MMYRLINMARTLLMLVLTPIWIILTSVMAFLHVEWTYKLISDLAEKVGYHRHV